MKTVLHSILAILILAGVFFFALRTWQSRQGIGPTGAPTEASSPSVSGASQIRDVTVQSNATGATMAVSDLPGALFRVTPSDTGNGFVVDVTGAEVGLLRSPILSPHPLVARIEASQIPTQGGSTARLRVDLTQPANVSERLQGSTLYIDITPKVGATATPEVLEPVASTHTPSKSKKVLSPTSKKAKATARKTEHRKAKAVTKSSSKRRTHSVPPPDSDVASGPADAGDSDALLNDLGIADTTPPAKARAEREKVPVEETMPEPPPMEAPPMEAPAPSGPSKAPESVGDIDSLLSDSPGADDTVPPPPEEEAPPPKVAAIPPSSGKFDSKKIDQNFPALSDLVVQPDGPAAVVRIGREARTKFKILQQREPFRIVVDFLNTKNGLKESYRGVAGTKVERVTTQSFQGPDGTISRVIIYLSSGPPKFEKSVEGTTFVLKVL